MAKYYLKTFYALGIAMENLFALFQRKKFGMNSPTRLFGGERPKHLDKNYFI